MNNDITNPEKKISMGISIAMASVLGVLTLVLHGSALQGFWRFDDPMVLQYVVKYPRVVGYFFSPEQWQALAVPFFTPWLVLEYWLDWTLFGLDPAMFYAHHLVMIWLASFLTFMLLRRHAGFLYGGMAAALFLAGAPVAVVAQQIMARHYVTGLVFAIFAMFFWLRAQGRDGRKFLWMASGCYLLAMLNKEIYAPLPMVLFFLMDGRFSSRLRALLPLALVAGTFLVWRALMLGRVVGGYDNALHGVNHIRGSMTALPQVFFGTGWLVWAGGIVFILAVVMVLRLSLRNGLLVGAGLIALLLPFLAVQVSTNPINLRFAFLFWWGVCVVTALGFSSWRQSVLSGGNSLLAWCGHILMFSAALIISAAAFKKGQESAYAYQDIASQFDVQGRFIWDNDATVGYVSPAAVAGSATFSHPLSLLKLQLFGKDSPVSFPFAAAAAKFSPGLPLYTYDSSCRCIKEQAKHESREQFQAALPMSVRLARTEDSLDWAAQAPEGSECFIFFQEIRMSVHIPCSSGKVAFDFAPWIKGKFRFVVRIPEKQWNASPNLIFPAKGMVTEWRSSSVIDVVEPNVDRADGLNQEHESSLDCGVHFSHQA
jgi:hypothetical protein